MTQYAIVTDLNRCVGCLACMVACKAVNNVPVGSYWNKVLRIGPSLKEGGTTWHDVEMYYLPVQCQHCDDPECVRVCPTKATFKREDGIVVMDPHRCIGCRYCMAGCPFGARSFNFRDPQPYVKDVNPEFPMRTRGVVEKCTFCTERLAQGKLPACVEASEGAMIFGDLNDPDSPVRQALSKNFTIRRKPTLGTQPGVYYII